MKKYLHTSLIMCCLLFISMFSTVSAAEKPDYEKYGRIAISVVKEDYPGDEVKEYQYMGRTKTSATDVTDSFRFRVTEQGKPKTVIVKISHNLQNKKLLNLSVGEQKQ